MHKYTKNELNRLKNNAVIGADAHTRFPPTQTIFYHNLLLVYYLYI